MDKFTCIAIDDDKLFLRKLEAYIDEIDWLELLGAYEHPIQAATAIIRSEPDLLFLDIEMPHIDGYALLDWILPRLKEFATKPKIVVVSGSIDKLNYAHDEVLLTIPKPLIHEPEDLARMVWEVVKSA